MPTETEPPDSETWTYSKLTEEEKLELREFITSYLADQRAYRRNYERREALKKHQRERAERERYQALSPLGKLLWHADKLGKRWSQCLRAKLNRFGPSP